MNSTRRWFGTLAVAPILFAAGLAHAEGPRTHRPLCDPLRARPGEMRCYAHALTNPDGTIHSSAAPQGYGPADLAAAYSIPAHGPGDGKIVAIVDANDSPDVESDLAMYRSTFGLPACTTANGCFIKLNQDGVAGSYPAADTGWAGEIALDVDMVSAVCPTCKIMLVEASSANTDDLGVALLTAIKKGAVAVSNSYGGGESSGSGDVAQDTQYFGNHPGILITASAGDNGYGASYPATSTYVLAIGGTSLVQDSSSRGWSETAWDSTGSGCSAEFPRPAWQSALPAACTKRMESDISASADPQNAVATYCSNTDCGSGSGWVPVGGTSESSPIIAGLFTLLGLNTHPPSWYYSNTDKFYDVTSGSNGSCSSSGKYYCNAGTGYDGPTGWGSPNSTKLASGGVQTGPDAGAGDDAGSSSGDGGATSGDGGATGDDGGTTSGDDGGTVGTGDDAGSIYTPPPSTDEDSGATTTVAGDAGNNGFGSGGPASSSGCSCNAPGTQSPLGETGTTMLALGAIALLVSRRRRD